MKKLKVSSGFTLVEAIVGVVVFVTFAIGIYGAINTAIKAAYQSRLNILETSILREQLETIRNLPYDQVGEMSGVPNGVLPHTTTTVRNNARFDIVYTVRNVDDPYDGTLGGTPNDTAPADFKLVNATIQCENCAQQVPVTLSTMVGPKNLENSSDNGALFINVFDANGLPLAGANVHIVNNDAQPKIVIDDVTGIEGFLHIVDTPTGTHSYNITVAKSGYSSDYTVTSSLSNPSPLKLPQTVATQNITDVYFAIDRTGSLNVNTVRANCSAYANKFFTLEGSKLVGLSPNVKKYSAEHQTDGSGIVSLSDMEWDPAYTVSVSGTGYDLAGSIPLLPLNLAPGMNQNLSLVLVPHTANSLLVKVKDAGSGQPLSDASVELSKPGYDQTKVTGLGYAVQTDWSGGSGEGDYSGGNKYFFDNSRVDVNSSAGDIRLWQIGSHYVQNGYLESGTFDLGIPVDFKNIVLLPQSQPPETGASSVLIQLAFSNTSTPASWDFVGDDGTTSTFYSVTSTIVNTGGSQYRYFRYRVYLSTDDVSFTPQFSEFTLTFVTSCNPPGQSFFGGLEDDTYNLTVTRTGYTTASSTIDVSGNGETTINLSPSS